MSTPPAGLRERKKLETHRTLSATAVRLIGEYGLDQVTVDDIAAEAGVSTRTFFNYFASKEDSVLIPHADREQRMTRMLERFAAQPPELGSLAALLAASRADLVEIDRDPREWLTRLRIVLDNPGLTLRALALDAETFAPLAAAVARRSGTDPAKDVFPTLVLSLLGGTISATLRLWSESDGTRPLVELFDEAAALATGLAGPA
ncbi:TetR/AcrR family transcriptional regulator [Amycolatopsis jiangsuensis]|uniref:AcrR family transcriptional regulator n=1 Tax=Amycolatopsis jiangsuensis TaxID=1181879 RepID=A0A840IK72_9PSEU|nr:TetR/AcrR family transcriptional regulator [Amycolatopsis jiangsuensis]MBB4682686.1 AcrR family transcriptional regulator [Amycolatopsis jiangsuensis]